MDVCVPSHQQLLKLVDDVKGSGALPQSFGHVLSAWSGEAVLMVSQGTAHPKAQLYAGETDMTLSGCWIDPLSRA